MPVHGYGVGMMVRTSGMGVVVVVHSVKLSTALKLVKVSDTGRDYLVWVTGY